MTDLDTRLRSAAAVLEETGDRMNPAAGLARTPPAGRAARGPLRHSFLSARFL